MARSRLAPVTAMLAVLTLGVGLALSGGSAHAGTRRRKDAEAQPPIHHIWVINLENESFGYTFGRPGAAPYLSQTLAGEGALLSDYYGIGHDSLDDYIAQVSGQAPDYET